MIKKRKKLLFVFIIIIIAVLLFSVVWVITVYLAWPQPVSNIDTAEYQAVIDSLNLSWNSITVTNGSGDIIPAEIGE